jgi:RNA polymerase sigma factor (sigma-70 family)
LRPEGVAHQVDLTQTPRGGILATVPSIGRAAPPEAEATRDLYEQYASQVFRFCLHQLGSREEAEDAVQTTFLNAFRGLKRGVVPELEAAWLFKIAHNVCLSRRRSTWRRGRVESPADFGLVEELAPAPSRRADELIGLQDVLEGMPEPQRRAILLREWQGLSYREIAEELELSQSAVETLIFRARRSLASGLERPAEVPRRRLRAPAAALANLLSAAQGWLFGGGAAAVKVAATVAAVGAGTVVATAPVERHHAMQPPAHAPVGHVVRRAAAQPAAPAPVVAPPRSMQPAPHVQHRAPVHKAPVRHARAPKPAARSMARAATPPPAAPAVAPPVETAPPPARAQRPVVTRGRSQQRHGKAHEAHGRATPPGKTHAAPQPHPPKKAAPPTASAQQPPASGTHGNGGGDGAGQSPPHGNGK